MKIKKDDVVRLKSINKIVRESKTVEIDKNKIQIKNYPIIVNQMHKFFGGTELNVDCYFSEDGSFRSNGYTFSEEWVNELFVNEKELWDKPKESEICYRLFDTGEVLEDIFCEGSYDKEIYNQGNISYDSEKLEFISKQREVQFKVRRFMEKNNYEYPRWEIYVHKDTFKTIKGVFEFSSEWRFSTKELAESCLKLVGEYNWRKYILKI